MKIEQLAREAGLGYAGPHHPGATQGGLRYFHALAIAAEHKRLLEGSGEPVACIHKGFMYMAHEFMSGIPKDADKLYTADQLAAAVLRERERCAAICERHKLDGQLVHNNAVMGCAAAIRSRK